MTADVQTPDLTLDAPADVEVARQLGIALPRPRLSLGRKLLLAAAFLLALLSTSFGALFGAAGAVPGDGFQMGVTECPMVGRPAQPST